MRKRNIYILYLPLWNVLLIVLSGCLNKYEKDIVGNYEVKNYELTDSTKTLNFTLPKLLIKKDKTFLLSFDETKLEGKWEADDFGDWTLATFYLKGNKAQARVGNGSLIIENPWQFKSPFLKKMEFEKLRTSNNNF